MVHLILTGATGLVGSSVLAHILSLPAGVSSGQTIHKLSILSRSATIPWLSASPPPGTPAPANKHTQIEVIEHRDFNTYSPELLEKLKGADACIWALGISQNDVSKEEYEVITRDYTLAAAKAFSSLREQPSSSSSSSSSPPSSATAELAKKTNKFKFIYVSGEGATFHPRVWTPLFGRVKGETERALVALSKTSPTLSAYSVRPAGVDAKPQPWIWDHILDTKRTAFQRNFLKAAMGPIRAGVFGSAVHSPTDELGRVLVEMAVSEKDGPFSGAEGVDPDGEGRVLGNRRLRMLGKGEGWWE